MQQATSKSEILTIREVAEVLRCSKAHVCNVLQGRVHGLPKADPLRAGTSKAGSSRMA